MKIRMASIDDASAIGQLHAESWRSAYANVLSVDYLAGGIDAERIEYWQNRLAKPAVNLRVLVAEDQESMIGFACCLLDSDTSWGSLLDNLHVSPRLKRTGIGQKIMWRMAELCQMQAIHKGLYLWVLEPNQDAQRFYRRLGATHADSDIWFPPGGGQVTKYRYVWPDVGILCTSQ